MTRPDDHRSAQILQGLKSLESISSLSKLEDDGLYIGISLTTFSIKGLHRLLGLLKRHLGIDIVASGTIHT